MLASDTGGRDCRHVAADAPAARAVSGLDEMARAPLPTSSEHLARDAREPAPGSGRVGPNREAGGLRPHATIEANDARLVDHLGPDQLVIHVRLPRHAPRSLDVSSLTRSKRLAAIDQRGRGLVCCDGRCSLKPSCLPNSFRSAVAGDSVGPE